MDTLFMNLENSKTSDPHRLLLNFSGKIYLKGSDRMLLYQITACAIHGKILKNHTKAINLNYLSQRGLKNLNCLMDNILYQIFKIILNILSKKNQTVTDKSSNKNISV